jgi:Fur family ferric uptake transcriptional regulator
MPPRALRLTRQQRGVLQAFEEAEQPLASQEAWEVARRETPGLGLATVYRSVKLLLDAGKLNRVDVEGESPRYELAGKGHHHHFYCRECAKITQLPDCPAGLKDLVPPGYAMEDHTIVIYGRCDACVAEHGASGESPAAGHRHVY